MKLELFKNTKVGTYEQMCDEWEEMIGEHDPRQWKTYGGDTVNEWSHFSMYDTVEYEDDNEDDEWIVKYPDFNTDEIIHEGEVKVYISDWQEANTTLTNPTVKDVYRFFANNHDGHHGFLEAVEYHEDMIILHSGS